MADPQRLFRQKALEKFSSPEQLDRLMRVTSPAGWLALLAVLVLLSAAIVWAFLGRIKIRLDAKGLLIRKGGLFAVQASGHGRILRVQASVGDRVEKGQVVAELSRPELDEEIRIARSQLEMLTGYREIHQTYGKRSDDLGREERAQRRRHLELQIDSAHEQMAFLVKKREAQEEALGLGLIQRDALAETIARYEQAKNQEESAKSELKALEVRELVERNVRSKESEERDKEIANLEARIGALEKQLESTTRVVSFHGGRVTEIQHGPGDLVSPGVTILSLEPEDAPLEALILMVRGGKRVHEGMRAEIAPVTVKKEEHGYMIGRISSVSRMPSTREALLHVLRNPDLIQELTGGAAPITLHAELTPDPGTPSGFRWSSSEGPPIAVQAGTVLKAEIVVETQAPISLVLPFLRRTLGM